MNSKSRPITQTEARRSLHALDVLSGRVTEPPKTRNKPVQREAAIQTALFKWAAAMSQQHPELGLLFHIPNGNKRDIITGYHLKQQGLKAGLPDVCLPVARGQYHGLYLELKSERGRLQDNQKEWLDELSKQGYKAVTAYGFLTKQKK